jgi:hypothetical protein
MAICYECDRCHVPLDDGDIVDCARCHGEFCQACVTADATHRVLCECCFQFTITKETVS